MATGDNDDATAVDDWSSIGENMRQRRAAAGVR